MNRTEDFKRRVGAVFLPQADAVDVPDDDAGALALLAAPPVPPPVPLPKPPIRICRTTLKQGCYTLAFTPAPATIFSTRFRGTLRVEQQANGRMRFSGDLYSYRWFDHIKPPFPVMTDEAADTGGAIPIYTRRSYFAYLKGTSARMSALVPAGKPCTFSLSFDQFNYNQPATGFSGSFNPAPTRSVRFDFTTTTTPGLYNGTAFLGSTPIGSVSIRWVSDKYRKANVNLHTLKGAVAPPASVAGSTMETIFADVGWGVTYNDGGQINLPSSLSSVNINSCWSQANLHTLMQSVPGYNPAALDSAWNVQLVAVPAQLGCSRGIMFDSGPGDLDRIPREGSATFSHDGYPANEVPDGMGGSHYDSAANKQQKDVPRAYLRSATHEIGHAFNQIHQNFEAGLDNSIMSPTPSVAEVLGLTGTFPNDIALRFNDTVKGHLRHLPDPAVRPGAMEFFGSTVSAPQAADVAWLDGLDMEVTTDVDRVALGQPVQLSWTLTNNGQLPIPAPSTLDVETQQARVSVTDPLGHVTFMRTPALDACPHLELIELAPGESIKGSTTLYWGTDGFAFEVPGHHVVDVIGLWDAQGTPIGAQGETHVFVTYPQGNENEVAALLLHPDVGRAVATGALQGKAQERIGRAQKLSGEHAATEALQRIGIAGKPKRPSRAKRKK